MNKKLKEKLWRLGFTTKKCIIRENDQMKLAGYKIYRGEKQVSKGEYCNEFEAERLASGELSVV